MADVALVPKRHILQRDDRVAANHARQAAQTLTRNWVAFVRHGRATFLPFAKKFFHFENFRPLKVTELSRPAIDAGGEHGQRRHEFRMAIALNDLSRKRRRLQPEVLANGALDSWIDMRVRADRTA